MENNYHHINLSISLKSALLLPLSISAAFLFYNLGTDLYEKKVYKSDFQEVAVIEKIKHPEKEITDAAVEKANQDKIEKYNAAMKEAQERVKLKSNKDTVDSNQITKMEDSVSYKGVEFSKIGYHKDGVKMTEIEKSDQVKKTYNDIKEKGDNWYITYPAKNEVAGIFVFTDPTCGFCKKLHNSIPELNAKGITVNYLMYPRMLPMGSDSPEAKSVISQFKSAWCSGTPKESLNNIYAGMRLPAAECKKTSDENTGFPVYEHYFLGQLFNVEATPTIFSSDGKVVEGFRDADTLIQRISH